MHINREKSFQYDYIQMCKYNVQSVYRNNNRTWIHSFLLPLSEPKQLQLTHTSFRTNVALNADIIHVTMGLWH